MNKFELYCQVARAHAQEQQARHQQFLMRAGIILGFSATLVGLAGLTVSGLGSWNLVWIIPFGMMLAFFLLVAVSYTLVLWTYTGHRSPGLREFSENLSRDDIDFCDEVAAKWVGDAYSEAINVDEVKLEGKAIMLRVALIGLVAEAASLAVLAAMGQSS